MGRNPTRKNDPKPPSDPRKAIRILKILVRDGEKVSRLDARSIQCEHWRERCYSELVDTFGSPHPNVQAFSAPEYHEYSEWDPPRDMKAQMYCQLAVLRGILYQLEGQFSQPNQVFLPAGTQHSAYVQIRKLVQQATNEIFVIDGYVDHTLWRLLSNIPAACKVRILTKTMKGDFTLEGARFAAQHSNVVEVRTTHSYHDRFIVADGKCFHVGCSIKDAGNKAFALSEIHRPQLVQAIGADLESEWSNAALVQL